MEIGFSQASGARAAINGALGMADGRSTVKDKSPRRKLVSSSGHQVLGQRERIRLASAPKAGPALRARLCWSGQCSWAFDAEIFGLASIRTMSLQSVSFSRFKMSVTRWSSASEKCMITLIDFWESLAFS